MKLKIGSRFSVDTVYVLIGVFLVLAYLAHLHKYFYLDLTVTQQVQRLSIFMWFDFLMRIVSTLGNLVWGFYMLTLLSLLLLILKKKNQAFFLCFSTLGAEFISMFFKILVGRPRPDPIITFDSFPSGHVLYFMGFYGFLLYLNLTEQKKGVIKHLLTALLILLILLVGVSRIYLGFHWFSDVYGAYLLGLAWLLFVIKVYKRKWRY